MSIELEKLFPALPKTTRGQALVLGGDPKGETFLYTNDLNVIICNIKDLGKSDLYSQHSYPVNVAKYSPSRFYIASGDNTGKVRVWDTVNAEHITKEFQPFSGTVSDVAWSPDSQKIVVVGQGRELFGKVIQADTGTNAGEMQGHTKKINSCDFTSKRPFGIITGSEDRDVRHCKAFPIKDRILVKKHENFVNVVKFAPDGTVFASGDHFGKAYVFDGKTGDEVGELGDPAHTGAIYGLSFSPDSKQILTASGDKTCKVFDVATRTVLHDFDMGDRQLSCLWQNEHLISVSLSGCINFLDQENLSQPKRIIQGHNQPITALTVSEDGSHFYTGGSNKTICEWEANTGNSQLFSGSGHESEIKSMKMWQGSIISVAIDDTIMVSDVENRTYGDKVKLPSQPRCVDVSDNGLAVVACYKHVVVYRNGQIEHVQETSEESTCVAVTPEGTEVALGGIEHHVKIYSVNGGALTESRKLPDKEAIVVLAYSPNGNYLAVVNASRRFSIYTVPSYEAVSAMSLGIHHTARITTLHWSPNSHYLMSAGLDRIISVFNINTMREDVTLKHAFRLGLINQARWLSNDRIVAVNNDCNTKVFKVNHK